MAFLKTEPGDMFAIPTHNIDGEVGFVIARHIDLNFDVPVFEVFKKFYTSPPATLAAVDVSERLFRPVMMLLHFGISTIPTAHKWRILFKDPSYHRDQSNFNQIQIGYPHSGGPPFNLWEGGKDRKVSKEEVEQVENSTWWTPLNLGVRVADHLANLVGPTEQYDVWKITGIVESENNRVALTALRDKQRTQVEEDSRIMAERFKQWAAEAKKAKPKKKPKSGSGA